VLESEEAPKDLSGGAQELRVVAVKEQRELTEVSPIGGHGVIR
jgi:hypothetical protein